MVEQGEVRPPVAGEWGVRPEPEDGRCGKCRNCSLDLMDAQRAAEYNRQASGFGHMEVLGKRPCLNQPKQAQTAAERVALR